MRLRSPPRRRQSKLSACMIALGLLHPLLVALNRSLSNSSSVFTSTIGWGEVLERARLDLRKERKVADVARNGQHHNSTIRTRLQIEDKAPMRDLTDDYRFQRILIEAAQFRTLASCLSCRSNRSGHDGALAGDFPHTA